MKNFLSILSYIFILFLSGCKYYDKEQTVFNLELETNKVVETIIDSLVAWHDHPDLKVRLDSVYLTDTLKHSYTDYITSLCKFYQNKYSDKPDTIFHDLYSELDTIGVSKDRKISIEKIFRNKKYKVFSINDFKKRTNYYTPYIVVDPISIVMFNRDKDMAFVYFTYGCGVMCGQSSCFFLNKKDKKWNILHIEIKSIS